MEIIFELFAELLFEFAIQGVFELLGHGLAKLFSKKNSPLSPWLTVLGYMIMGAIAGGISIWWIPMHLAKSPAVHLLNLALTPIMLGFAFELFGRWKTKVEKPRYAFDRFSYGFTFALTMGLVRYFFAA
jgi:hypothetical protein